MMMEETAALAQPSVSGQLKLPQIPRDSNRPLDDRIWSLPPHTAISYGYALYKATDRLRTACARHQARAIVRDMELRFALFDPQSTEGAYVLAIRMAAVSFAEGIRRRKQQMRGKLKYAKVEISRFREKHKRDQRLGYFMSVGAKLALLGGFTWLLVKTLLLPHLILTDPTTAEATRHGLDPNYVSLCAGLASACLGAVWTVWRQDSKIGKALETYETKTDAAYEEYVEAVTTEYRFAANESQLAWAIMTDRPAPTTPASPRPPT